MVINFKIYGSVVKSFALWPLEFLLSKVTPYCKKALNIYGAAPAAANITLLFPEQSTSYQCKPALRRIYVMSRWFLKQAQCKGLGFISFVEPMATWRFSGLTSRYCWPAPFESKSLTMEVKPEQQAQMRAFHFFLVFSEIMMEEYLHMRYRLSFWDISKLIRVSFSWQNWLVFSWVQPCFYRWLIPLPLLLPPDLQWFWFILLSQFVTFLLIY